MGGSEQARHGNGGRCNKVQQPWRENTQKQNGRWAAGRELKTQCYITWHMRRKWIRSMAQFTMSILPDSSYSCYISGFTKLISLFFAKCITFDLFDRWFLTKTTHEWGSEGRDRQWHRSKAWRPPSVATWWLTLPATGCRWCRCLLSEIFLASFC